MCFSRIIFNEATCNNTQRCLLCKTLSIDLTRLNSIFPIVAAAVRYALKSINSCIRAWFQLSPPSAKRHQIGLIPINLKFYCYLCTFFQIAPFSLYWNFYLPAGVATRRDIKISANVLITFEECLWGGLVLIKLQIPERVRFMKYELFLQGLLQ